MPRTWQELFVTGDEPEPARLEEEDGRESVLRRLVRGMSRTRRALGAELRATVAGDEEEAWERLEEALIRADVGVPVTARAVARLEAEAGGGELDPAALRERLAALLAEAAPGEGTIDLRPRPTVILVVGVNGTGKTTTIGKLAWHLGAEAGRSVLLAAADTFRAAAGEQLAVWAERAGCDLVRSAPGADPGAVAYDAIEAADARGRDVVIVDTAGRMHTESPLMEELRKVRRVIADRLEGAPHETLLTIDATTGQNGLRQARLFDEAVGVTGVALTKLDGTARGGIALAIGDDLGVPVKLIGVGEGLEDLRPFDAGDFAHALVAPEDRA